MRKLFILLVVALAMLLLVPGAGAAPTSYDSGFQVQNLSSTSSANIIITFYLQTGAIETSISDTVLPNDSNTYYPLPAGVGAAFDGSVVISSDQPVAAIANVLGDGIDFGASYGGFDGGANSVSLPLIMKNNAGQYDTWFNVQNTGASATTVTVSYANTACTENRTIQPGAAQKFDQDINTCLPSPYVGAATVTAGAGGEIVATVMETGNETLFAYNGFTGGATDPVLPLVQFNNAGFHTGVQIQNTHASSASNITVSYTPAAGQPGTACTETKTLNPGTSDTFGLFAFSLPGGTNSTCTFGQQFVGSARVTTNSANVDLVAIVNQTNFANYGSSYNGFDPSTATASVVMPLIMDRNSGFFTGFNLMNVGSSASVTCDFSGTTYTVGPTTLGTGSTLNALQLNQISTNYVGSATCNAPGGGLIAVVNELGSSTVSDLLFTYEAFSQ